ncbi:MAG: ion transporter [Kiritimatiellia bacterium]|jgi:voltage-gated potassium channel|nr:ion transporter [Kiritimatiellia bacterium]
MVNGTDIEQPGMMPGRDRIRRIIFEADTPAGKLYDLILIATVALSVLVVMLDSVSPVGNRLGSLFYAVEWGFTILFTVDYVTRMWCVNHRFGYAFSFFGLVDLLGVLPTYLSLIIPGSHYLVAIRFLRVLRIFHVLKLSSYQSEVQLFRSALKASRRRIAVFLFAVLTLVVVLGSLMYVVEGPKNGFTSIPRGIYWAVVTLTTVGYGDISPKTALGQTIAAMVMIIGYSIIVVPTGIVSSALTVAGMSKESSSKSAQCDQCGTGGHETDARFCRYCGASFER